MIFLYSGTPGSGKSYHAVSDIIFFLKRKKPCCVISNFDLVLPSKCRNDFYYFDNSEFTPQFLIDFANSHPVSGGEGRYKLFLDESQLIFNCRDWSGSDRQSWVSFFTQHRKYGFDIYLIAQFDRMLDRQIRCLIETEIKHRKVNNYKAGFLVSLLNAGRPTFVAISYWYGGNKLFLERHFIPARNKIYKAYNTNIVLTGS